MWAKVGSHPWWPGLVCNDPEAGNHLRVKPRAGQRPVQECHVTFFGENTRAWVVSNCFRSRNVYSELLFQDERNLKQFEGLEKYYQTRPDVRGHGYMYVLAILISGIPLNQK